MTSFRVEDMTCGRCASAITRALQAVDAAADVQVDVASRLVHVRSAEADAAALAAAISDAGYRPVPTQSRPGAPARASAGGCGCGTSGRCA